MVVDSLIRGLPKSFIVVDGISVVYFCSDKIFSVVIGSVDVYELSVCVVSVSVCSVVIDSSLLMLF